MFDITRRDAAGKAPGRRREGAQGRGGAASLAGHTQICPQRIVCPPTGLGPDRQSLSNTLSDIDFPRSGRS